MGAHIKGSALIPRINYLKQHHAQAWPQIVERVLAPTREMLEVHPLATTWYPFELFVDLMATADQVAGKGDLDLVRVLGHHAATANLSTILRIFIRFGSPEYILTKASKVWRLYHDSGRTEIVSTSPKSISLSVIGHAAPHRTLCFSLVGWVAAYLEVAGCKQVVVTETKCAVRGDEACRFDAHWA